MKLWLPSFLILVSLSAGVPAALAQACLGQPNGTPCDDGNFCTVNDTCQAGVCVSGSPVVCTAVDQCHDAGVCNPATGMCSNPAKPNGTACNDDNACTQTDVCQAGVCTGSNPVTCTATDQCHDPGTCDPVTGACSNPVKPNGSACDDGNYCTTGDTCQAGTCSAGAPLNCDDGIACTTDTCDSLTGACIHTPVNAFCDDGSPCTDDSCDPFTGCVNTPNGTCTPPPCTSLSVSPSVVSATAAAGSQGVTITASPADCAWTTTSNAGFLSLFPTSGYGSGPASVNWTANSGPSRAGSVSIDGSVRAMLVVNQAAGAVGFGSSTTHDLVYTTLTQPCRIIDTRLAGGALAAGTTRDFKVAGSGSMTSQGGSSTGCGVPSGTAGATAVMINFVAVDPAGPGNLRGSAWPNPVPSIGSIVNYQALNPALNIANGVVFPICDPAASNCAAGSDMTLLANASGTQIVADVIGYFSRYTAPQSFLTYTTLPRPCRIIDTRIGGGALAAGVPQNFVVAGTAGFDAQGGTAGGCGIPDAAKVAVINFVAVDPLGAGNLKGSSFPNAIPATGNLINYQALSPALNIANGLLFPLCDRSTTTCPDDITLQPNVSGTQVVADVLGYFSGGWQPAGATPPTQQNLVYTTLQQPCRIIDTRLGGGTLSPGTPQNFKVTGSASLAGQGGNASGCGVPDGATVAMINFTAVTAQGVGNFKGAAFPNAIPATGSILNYQALNPALNIANGVLFPLCDPAVNTCTNNITLQANVSGAQLVADVTGYATRVQPTSVTLTPSSATVTATTAVQFTVSLDVPAVTPTTITLAVMPSNAGTLPASVIVPADQTSATFPYTPSIAGEATVTATFGSSSGAALVTATP